MATADFEAEKLFVANPCVDVDMTQPDIAILKDAFHLNASEGTCTQVCVPQRIAPVAAVRGVDFGSDCLELGFTQRIEDGVRHGVHFFKYLPG